jgi:hypothetical protein
VTASMKQSRGLGRSRGAWLGTHNDKKILDL